MYSFLSHSTMAGLRQWFGVYQTRVSTGLALLMFSASAWVAGDLIWVSADASPEVPAWQAVSVSAGGSRKHSGTDTSLLEHANLFGVYNEQVSGSSLSPVVTDAPKTRLDLILVGVVRSSDVSGSLAVIANHGSQATYGIDEEIEGTHARLKTVLVDRVIIENAGRHETLMLEGIEYQHVSAAPSEQKISRAALRGGNNPSPADETDIEEIKQAITEDPQQIMQYIRMSQVKEGEQITGYRVSPGKKRALFDAVGLEDGDVAIALNGEDLTDPDVMGQILQSVSELTELNLTVIRDGQPYDIYIVF